MKYPQFSGLVIKGNQRGKSIGFPTANIAIHHTKISGVFISTTNIDGKQYRSVTHIGIPKTFQDKNITCETYILDFSKNIYGKQISITLHKKIRGIQKFHSVEELKQHITQDVIAAKDFINNITTNNTQ